MISHFNFKSYALAGKNYEIEWNFSKSNAVENVAYLSG